ncbi:MAG: NAD(+) synthase [Chloroflexi bacterium RBG_16_48_8]|nr:MAG: NAD(+) synthase [Chloroflexi bacterium RBG_16_48_8]
MRLALAQVNPIIADLEGNVARCLAAIQAARLSNPDLVILPELAIPGCPPRDILFDTSFPQAVYDATQDLAQRARSGPPVLVGTLSPAEDHPPGHPGLYNAAFLLKDGVAHLAAAKRLLPAHDVFYEPRWFLPGPNMPPITIAGKRVGILICEDLWDEGYPIHPPAELLDAGAELLVCMAASPYRHEIMSQRLYHARRTGCSLAYVNLCGGNDELIFDGRSFALDSQGQVIAQLAGFEEEVRTIDLTKDGPIQVEEGGKEEITYQALVLGVRDFVYKNNLKRAFLGLSGGVDSAVVAAIATEAIGPEHVTAVTIPSRYTDPHSTACALHLAAALGTHLEVVDLEPLHETAEKTLGDMLESGTAGENIQPRLRAMILMSYVNRHGGVLLNTSNKTELSLGYATTYGDMAGTLCPIADLTKLEVYALARWINATQVIIPLFILERPPTAELKPDQVDPFDYPTVSPEIERLVQENRSNLALRKSEHKRWQMGVVLKISPKAFGTGRMIPITRR